MKKIMILALVAMTGLSAFAQRPTQEEMQARRAEMIEKQADRLAKDMDLKGDAKTQFVATFKAYQQELASTQQNRRNAEPRGERGQQSDKKKLTDEEAQKQVQEYFDRQERQLAQQQARLEIEKKYLAEFQKTLTPQQLVKIFHQQRMQSRQGGQNFRQGGFGGPQGGNRQGGFGGGQPGGGFGGDF